MNITQLLKNYETICLSFGSEDETKLKTRLLRLGFKVPENFRSPVIIHRNGTLSFITGFVSGMFFSQSEGKLKRAGIIKTDYKKLSPEEIKSGWYKARIYYNNV